MRRTAWLLIAWAAAAPLAAQQSRDDARLTLRGTVVDSLSGTPLPNAMVRSVQARRGVLTDSLGRFVLDGLPPGPQTLEVRQYSYEGVTVELAAAQAATPLRIALPPGPYAIQGFDVVADRLAEMTRALRARSLATGVSVRALDQNRLAQSGAPTLREFLEEQGGIERAGCDSSDLRGACIRRRGRTAKPRVYIDEIPAIGGLEQLDSYHPSELYLVEIFSAGIEIRAYTHFFMERAARRTFALFPAMTGLP